MSICETRNFLNIRTRNRILAKKKKIYALMSNIKRPKPEYMFYNGLRYVVPYTFERYMYIRAEWINKTIYDVFCTSIYAYDKFNHYVNRYYICYVIFIYCKNIILFLILDNIWII